jgi:hypothetical protein
VKQDGVELMDRRNPVLTGRDAVLGQTPVKHGQIVPFPEEANRLQQLFKMLCTKLARIEQSGMEGDASHAPAHGAERGRVMKAETHRSGGSGLDPQIDPYLGRTPFGIEMACSQEPGVIETQVPAQG